MGMHPSDAPLGDPATYYKLGGTPAPKGVQFAPPPRSLLADAMKVVDAMSPAIAPGHHNALVGIATDAGVQVAIVHKTNDHVQVVGWLGKPSGWGTKVTGGGAVKVSW